MLKLILKCDYDIEDNCLDISNYGEGYGKPDTIHYWKYDGHDNYEKMSRDLNISFLKRMNK